MTSSAAPLAIAVFDIDGVLRDVGNSYRRALADTVEEFTGGGYRPSTEDVDRLKGEGIWNNDWEGSQELVYRYFEAQGKPRETVALDYDEIVEFFQRRYRGPHPTDPDQWTGYITQEPLLVEKSYFERLTRDRIAWGFFSGATRGSANFVLQRRLGLSTPALVCMEDAPGKPDPTGLMQVVDRLIAQNSLPEGLPIVYVGDTVADMQTVVQAKTAYAQQWWLGVGVLPPHIVASDDAYRATYHDELKRAGADRVISQVTEFTADYIQELIQA
ncbi:TIGR01548 family HAD-type hydrolase [Nodosilinea sp. LEGE 06152]|uniref:TIGR01548 family HAD-type hydrolase n=1 Tax=Nodosilinea sp. LEGE 06152 TaxID=2777966 RepID=UPI00187E0AEB|nr:TIGR01548 family HAD-type hydrolase [Nodosilinea sp. LEGE 06152]MBE9156953.1 TIGR01548 family HAD-type hydrolase [Nodosilinea sp. LEGE 06152]